MKCGFFIALVVEIFVFPAAAQEITNFRSGLACLNPDPEIKDFGRRSICVDTDVIHVTGQSVCVFDGEKRPCTWHGFEFEYMNANGAGKITCTNTGGKPGDFGDPKGVSAEGVTEFQYTIELEDDSGRFFNPQYTVYRANRKSDEEVVHETVCRAGERELFNFKFRFIYPATSGPAKTAGENSDG